MHRLGDTADAECVCLKAWILAEHYFLAATT